MYWSRTGDPLDFIQLLALLLLVSLGGWLIVRALFEVHEREEPLLGVGLGLVGLTWFSNWLARFLDPGWAFWLAGVLVVLAGMITLYSGERLEFPWKRGRYLWLFLGLIVLSFVFARMGRGIALFDDRKNLSIISTMAAGDVPPHFYMNPDYLFNYHYGFQLFGAILMRIGGLFPWSAFDLGKGIVSALAMMLAILWGWRVSHKPGWGVITGLAVAFASGGRWLLFFLPQSLIWNLSQHVSLWGASSATVGSLFDGLFSYWTVDGGPILPLPFAYLNGILQPFVLKLHKGPMGLNLVLLFLALMLVARRRNLAGTAVLTILFAGWALVAEAEFLLFGLGFAVFSLARLVRDGVRKFIQDPDLTATGLALLAAAALSLVQGGTITEMAKGMLGNGRHPELGGGTGLGGFALRMPPAIVSAHLGELSLANPAELLVGLFELGPVLLAGAVVIVFVPRWWKRDRFIESLLAFSSFIGFILPLLLRYDIDRDITRMSAYALLAWLLLTLSVLPAVFRLYRSEWLRIFTGAWLVSVVFGGLVVTGSLLASMPLATLSFHIDPVDAKMTRMVWNQLPRDVVVIDSHSWHSIPVTGRLTRSSADNTRPLDSWQELVESGDPMAIAEAGYDYIYMDEEWWSAMPPEIRATYSAECITLEAEVTDAGGEQFRRLYSIRGCSIGHQ